MQILYNITTIFHSNVAFDSVRSKYKEDMICDHWLKRLLKPEDMN